ncbi:MAG TPA: hypothetical protein VGC22_11865, partial [Chitinophaga sp.]
MKVLSGNHTPEEESLLQSAMRAQPAYYALYQQMQRYWTSSRPQPAIQVEKRLQQTWDKIHETTAATAPERRRSAFRKWAAIAACLAVTAGSGWLLLHNLRAKPAPVLVEKHNPKGVRSNITL